MTKLSPAESLTDQAYRTIRKFILETDLDDKFRLTEDYFCRELGVSKSPIREALNRIEAEGLISIHPRRGALLRQFSPEEMRDLYGLRKAIELYAVDTIPVTGELLQGLSQRLANMRTHHAAGDKNQYLREDVAFHAAIVEATGNQLLLDTLRRTEDRLWLCRRRTYDMMASNAADRHGRVLSLLAAGDRTAARHALAEHIDEACEQLVRSATAAA